MFKDYNPNELRVIAIATDEEDENWTSSKRVKIKSQRLEVQKPSKNSKSWTSSIDFCALIIWIIIIKSDDIHDCGGHGLAYWYNALSRPRRRLRKNNSKSFSVLSRRGNIYRLWYVRWPFELMWLHSVARFFSLVKDDTRPTRWSDTVRLYVCRT